MRFFYVCPKAKGIYIPMFLMKYRIEIRQKKFTFNFNGHAEDFRNTNYAHNSDVTLTPHDGRWL